MESYFRDKDRSSTQHLLSDDMARELERQRWEQAEIAQMEQEKQGPIHYADVRHNGRPSCFFYFLFQP